LTVQQRKVFLNSFDQSTSIGRRDYTIALCLIGLGMRSCEVADLDLNNIDWRKGILSIHSRKGRRTHQLPLSQEIGQSIANYIIHDRPSSKVKNIFVQHRAPLGARLTSAAIGTAIRKAFKRCGITIPFSGSRVLRQYGERYKMVSDGRKPAKPASFSSIHSPFYH
jgi:integrase